MVRASHLAVTGRQLAGALFVSAVVHAAAAVTLGGVLGPAYPLNHATAAADVDVAIVVTTQADAPTPLAAPGTETPAPVPKAPRRRPAVRPAVSAAADTAAPARFMLSAGTVAARPTTAAAAPATTAAGAAPSGEPAAFGDGDVNVPARLLAAAPLVYPPAARNADIEQDVAVDIVVDAGGRVVSARAAASAGYGLDVAAVRAIRDYRFSPAMRAGNPVAVRMRWTVQFRLR
jgi:periplasmic protein TonB